MNELANLKRGALGILETAPEDRALMVAEDPSVFDLVTKYVDALEEEVDLLEGKLRDLRSRVAAMT